MDGIELSDVIQKLRFDIEKTWWDGQSSGVTMEVGPVELELNVQVVKSGKGALNLTFYIANVNLGGEVSGTSSQKLKVTLTPRDRRNPSVPLLIKGTAGVDDDIPRPPITAQPEGVQDAR